MPSETKRTPRRRATRTNRRMDGLEWPYNFLADVYQCSATVLRYRLRNCPPDELEPTLDGLLRESMSPRQVETVRLYYQDNLPCRAVAQRQGISSTMVNNRVQQAQRLLRGSKRADFYLAVGSSAAREEERRQKEQGVDEGILNDLITMHPFCTRTRNALDKAGIRTIGDVVRLLRGEWRCVHLTGIGRGAIQEMHDILEDLGVLDLCERQGKIVPEAREINPDTMMPCNAEWPYNFTAYVLSRQTEQTLHEVRSVFTRAQLSDVSDYIISQLEPEQQQACRLRFRENRSFEEIADIMGGKPSRPAAILTRARSITIPDLHLDRFLIEGMDACLEGDRRMRESLQEMPLSRLSLPYSLRDIVTEHNISSVAGVIDLLNGELPGVDLGEIMTRKQANALYERLRTCGVLSQCDEHGIRVKHPPKYYGNAPLLAPERRMPHRPVAPALERRST